MLRALSHSPSILKLCEHLITPSAAPVKADLEPLDAASGLKATMRLTRRAEACARRTALPRAFMLSEDCIFMGDRRAGWL